MGLLDSGRRPLLWVVVGLVTLMALKLIHLHPENLDSALFSPLGATFFSLAFAMLGGGALWGGVIGTWPIGSVEGLAPVPAGAPLHVFGLLATGLFDLSVDNGAGLPPFLGLGALFLGGLWSRRLGPHREIWSWDVVEITAVDLMASEVIADHLWQKRPSPIGIAWGGGEVRLFRNGLTVSHHHLSSTGTLAPSDALWRQDLGALGWSFLAFPLAYAPTADLKIPPLRVKATFRQAIAYSAPIAMGEASLVGWALAIFAPSSGAIAAWGFWGAPLYLWFMLTPLPLYLGFSAKNPATPLWTHYPLIPLSHVFATPLPWAPYFLKNRFTLMALNG